MIRHRALREGSVQGPSTLLQKAFFPLKQKNNRVSFYRWENTKRSEKNIDGSGEYKRKLHSKLFFFHGESFEYCMLGSANASIAAFGTKDNRGVNDEFGILYKSNKIDFLKEMGINGKRVSANLSELQRESWVMNSESTPKNIKKSIKIESCDLDGVKITCFCKFSHALENVYLYLYTDHGDEILLSKNKIQLEEKSITRLTSNILENNLAYVLFKDENKNVISNKQVINNVSSLFSTDPAKENRAVRSLRTALEIGKINEYELLGYLSKLNERDHKQKTGSSNNRELSNEEKIEAHSEMTFEEAMAASKNNISNAKLSQNHNTVQFWQTLTSIFNERKEKVSEDLNEEEEEADATKSKDRQTGDSEVIDFEIKNDRAINRILNKTENLTNSFVVSMNRLARDKEYKINEVALCQFLLISHIVTVIHQYNTYDLPYDEKKKEYTLYTPLQWKKILYDKYYTLMQNILMAFSKMVLSHSIIKLDDDEYRKKNMNSFIQQVISHIFIYNYLINRNRQANPHSEMTDLACLNIMSKLGVPNDDFIELIETISKSKTDELFNTSGVIQLKDRIEKLFKKIETKDGVFKHKYDAYGVCLIKKIDNKTIYFKSLFDEHQIFKINIKDWAKL